ncbi:MAG TPA: hypothetical protein VHE37_06305, partial [Nevskiaceae bacterium]|nr:hypothetical protein [Nevskiaceae bacterium]
MTSTPATAARPRALLSLLLALAAAWGFWASIRAWLGAPILDLGSLNSPTPRLMAAWDNFAIFGSLCAAAVAWHLHARMETRDWDAWYRMRRQPL